MDTIELEKKIVLSSLLNSFLPSFPPSLFLPFLATFLLSSPPAFTILQYVAVSSSPSPSPPPSHLLAVLAEELAHNELRTQFTHEFPTHGHVDNHLSNLSSACHDSVHCASQSDDSLAEALSGLVEDLDEGVNANLWPVMEVNRRGGNKMQN